MLAGLALLLAALGVVSAPAGADAPFDNVLALDGADDYASIADNDSLDLGDTEGEDFTIEASFYVPDTTSDALQTVFYKQNAYALFVNFNPGSPDAVFFRWWDGPLTTDFTQLFNTTDLAAGWHHIAAVFDNEFTEPNDRVGIYLDGAEFADNSAATDLTPGIWSSASELQVGAGNGLNPLVGYVDEARFSDTVRYSGAYTVPASPFTSDGSTRALWHFDETAGATSFADASGNANTLTGNNGAVTASLSPGGTTITVDTTADELNADGDCSLREAVQAANADAVVDACPAGNGADTIELAAGTYALSLAGADEDLNATGDLDISADVTITGAGAGSTIIDGGGLDRVFHVTGTTVDFSGVTISGGGGGVCNGAGVHNPAGTVTLTEVVVTNNTGGEGGGLYNGPTATMTIVDSTISSNTGVKRGGGITNTGTMAITGSTISSNSHSGGNAGDPPCAGTASFGGAGIFNVDGGELTIEASTLSGNSAAHNGGAIYNYAATTTLTVTNSTLSGNSAGIAGGGIRNASSATATLNNTTLSGNSASGGAGGIHNDATLSLGMTIVANSTAGGDCSGTVTSLGYNLIENTASCTIAGDTTGNLTGSDPTLGTLADNGGPTLTHALLGGSPAINAGDPTCPPPATDQRGVTRPQAGTCDIGAYEFDTPTTITVDTTADELNADGDCSLREAVQAANADAAVDACPAGNGADTIDLPAGTYTLSIAGVGDDTNATGDLDISDDVTITGAGAATTVVDGNDLDRVVHVTGGTVAMLEVTVQGGGNNDVCEGGGIANTGGTLTLTGAVVSGNSGGAGGGVYNSATTTLDDTTVTGNSAAKRGGGIENVGVGSLTITNSTISDNTHTGGNAGDPPCAGTASFGAGGIFNADHGTLVVTDSTISGNSSNHIGGGIYHYQVGTSSVTIDGSTISGNSATDRGGGIAHVNGGQTTVTNSTISGNSAVQNGGAITTLSPGTLDLDDSTVSNNSSSNGAGGLHGSGTYNVGTTIVANNGTDCAATITSEGYNLIEDTASCTIAGDTTGNVTGSDPALGTLADNGGPTLTHALLGGSPAINAGDPACPPPATDQRGVTRPQAGTCDIGAYEKTFAVVADFDGDGDSDIGVYRNGAWLVRDQATVYYGLSTDIPVPGDYDGDGDTDRAVFRPGNGGWYVHGQPTVYFGLNGDIPVPGDYDGDGDTDVAVYRNGAWLVRNQATIYHGNATDTPVPADYDGDGDTDRAVFRPANGGWYIHSQGTVFHGVSTDRPVPGDYDGDGDADVAVYRNGAWLVRDQATVWYGLASDLPVPADYNGDGTTDRTVYRPANGGWYTHLQPTVWYGLSGDIPVTRRPQYP